MFFNYRFVPAFRLAKEFISSGEAWGRYITSGRSIFKSGLWTLIFRGLEIDKNAAGSGALGDLGAHIIDLACFLVGEITTVSSLTRTFIKERKLAEDPRKKVPVTVDDAFVALVESEKEP